jgi:hypothetical protein
VSLAVLAAASTTATAAPSAGQGDGAAVHLQLVTGGRLQQLALLVTTPSQGPAQLRVRLVSDTGRVTRLYGELPSGAVTTTGDPASNGTTTLRTRLGRLPLTVVWRIEPGAVAVSMGMHDSDGDTAEGWSVAGASGPVDVRLGTTRCRIDNSVVGPALSYDTTGYGRPLASGLGVPARGTSCRPMPNSLPPVP